MSNSQKIVSTDLFSLWATDRKQSDSALVEKPTCYNSRRMTNRKGIRTNPFLVHDDSEAFGICRETNRPEWCKVASSGQKAKYFPSGRKELGLDMFEFTRNPKPN